MIRVLFVCMGNICRSPLAQGAFERLLEQTGMTAQVQCDSAGTHAYHAGKRPDQRAIAAAARRGVEIAAQRARRVVEGDFASFDYVLAMDRENLEFLASMCPEDQKEKVSLLLDFAPELGVEEVPDPYYGDNRGFEQTLDLVEAAAEKLLHHIRIGHF